MKALIACALLLGCFTANADMVPMSNDALDETTGQQGVAISVDWRLNADASGNAATVGLCNNAATYKECRVGWAFNNRGTDDVDKRWLVLKGMSGALYIPYLSLDASSVQYAPKSGYTCTGPGGNCVVTAAKLSFADSTGSGANTKVQVKNLVIDAIAFEQDTASTRGYFKDKACEPTGAGTGTGVCAGTGANIPANVNTGFMGLQVNGPGNVANIQIDGTIKLYPCLSNNPAC